MAAHPQAADDAVSSGCMRQEVHERQVPSHLQCGVANVSTSMASRTEGSIDRCDFILQRARLCNKFSLQCESVSGATRLEYLPSSFFHTVLTLPFLSEHSSMLILANEGTTVSNVYPYYLYVTFSADFYSLV